MPRMLLGGMSAVTMFKSKKNKKTQVCTCYLHVFLNILTNKKLWTLLAALGLWQKFIGNLRGTASLRHTAWETVHLVKGS